MQTNPQSNDNSNDDLLNLFKVDFQMKPQNTQVDKHPFLVLTGWDVYRKDFDEMILQELFCDVSEEEKIIQELSKDFYTVGQNILKTNAHEM